MTETPMPALEPERRSAFIAQLHDIEWRKAGNGEDVTFSGSAIVYNSWSEPLWTPLGTFRERIMPGALDEVLANKPDVRLLLNHNADTVLARTKSGTLDLNNDADALRVWAKLDPTDPDVQRLRSKMRRGDIDQMSFAFLMPEADDAETWYEDEDSGEIRRDIHRIEQLLDVSPVTFPAYEQTTAALRELRERELRSAVEAGKISLPDEDLDAQAHDPAVDATNGDTEDAEPAETDPVDDEVDELAALRAYSSETTQRERETYLKLIKELTKP